MPSGGGSRARRRTRRAAERGAQGRETSPGSASALVAATGQTTVREGETDSVRSGLEVPAGATAVLENGTARVLSAAEADTWFAIADDATCANEGCGHPGSMHAGDDNAGACSAQDCACDGFMLELADGDDDGEAAVSAGALAEFRSLARQARPPVDELAARRATRAALIASGVAPVDVVSNYDLSYGSAGERFFLAEALAAGYVEMLSDRWPCELTAFLPDGIVFRDGMTAVHRFPDGTLAALSLGWDNAHLRVAGPSRQAAENAIGVFRSRYPASFLIETDDFRVPVTFWTDGTFGPVSRLRRIEAAPWADVEGNYPPAVRDALQAVMGWSNGPATDGQLILWQGLPGTGKTWALRALASEWAPWAEFHYITDPDAFFVSNAAYMIDVLLSDSYQAIEPGSGAEVTTEKPDGKWRVLILEDTGELLAADAKDEYGQGLSRLLNVVDGMIGQGLRVLCLVTTNDELGDLHPAVMRPGRCAQSLTFEPFQADEAQAWLEAHGLEGAGPYAADSPRTVAELYAALGESGTVTAAAADLLPPEHQPSETLPDPTPGITPPPTPPAARADTTGAAWNAAFCPEGRPTDDGRLMAPGGISWRELPLSLMAMLETQEGHDGARVGGRIDSIWRDEPASMIRASGVFDGGDFGQEVERLVGDGTLRGLSVDLAIRESVIARQSSVLDEDGNWKGLPAEDEEVDIWDLLLGEGDEPILFVVTDGVIGAATVCPFPAFAEAEISLVAAGPLAGPLSPFVRMTFRCDFTVGAQLALDGLTAAAAGLAPDRPPADWFHDPQLDALTALTVDDDGRVYGHAAPWDTCHIGIPGVCTTAPHSQTGYSFFHLGELELDDGARLPVGKITLGTGHADRRLGWQKTVDHYDDTGTVVAYVRAGEDEHGIWLAGAIDPNLDASRVRDLRAAVPSGDWRSINGNLEMVGVLAVNVPGFPVPRSDALVTASGAGARVLALVAAGHGPPPLTEVDAVSAERLRALAAQAAGDFEAVRVA